MAVNEIFYGTKYGEVGVATAPAVGGELANAGTMCHLTTLKIFTDKSAMTTSATVKPDGEIDPTTVSDCAKTVNVSPVNSDVLNISLTSSGTVNVSSSSLSANTVEIDDDPTNTYGLASKNYLYRTVLNHSNDPDAHSQVFSEIIKTFTDLYEKKGEFRVSQITDNFGNILYANGKQVLGGVTPVSKFVVLSSKKQQDFDALEARVKALEDIVLHSTNN